MEYRLLGNSGLKVSVLTMGTMTFGGRRVFAMTGSTDAAGARRQIDMCLDAGVNLIDTANVYSWGLSEEICGQAVKGRRDKILIATKARMPMSDDPNDTGASRHHIVAQCEASLRRLGTDYVDLYQIHQWDGQTPVEETMEALDTLVRAGKVRYIGASNYSGWHLMKALAAADRRGYQRFVSQQIHYTLEAREAEYELVPISLDQGLGILVWSPIAGGLLSGKIRRGKGATEGMRQFTEWGEPPIRDQGRLFDIIDALVKIADGRGVSAARIALAWLLGRPGVTSLVIGARTDAQLADNLKCVEIGLTREERATLDKVSQPPLLYPYWHQVRTAKDRLGPADLALLKPYL